MSEKKSAKTFSEPAFEDQKPVNEPTKYDRESLVEDSFAIFGYYPEVVVGALHGDTRQEFTVDEVKSKIQNFVNRKVD